ncbi:MAG: 50S ribosomal protein L29 [candidate division NC10 bacterium]|nr:50S ribosomal protein L29 [candidate division NC10 bacterium]
MEAREFRELSLEELQQKEADLREDLFKLKLRASVSQVENPMKIRQLRRDLARLKTVRREMELKTVKSKAPEG